MLKMPALCRNDQTHCTTWAPPLSNGYIRALASSDLIRYDMGQAMPTHITTGRLWYRPWRACPSPCFATLSMPHGHHVVFSHVHARTYVTVTCAPWRGHITSGMIWGRPYRPILRQGAFGTARGAPAHRHAWHASRGIIIMSDVAFFT